MKKKIGIWMAIGLTLAAIAGGGIAAIILKAPIMSFFLTHKMQLDVMVGEVGFSKNNMTIGQLEIKNPRGFKTRHALEAKAIDVAYSWSELRSNPSRIASIEADGIFLRIEFSNLLGTRNNWTEIIARMPKTPESEFEVVIQKLTLTNVTVEVYGLGLIGASKVIRIPRMDFDNISSKEGFPTKQLILQIFQTAGVGSYIQNALSPLIRTIWSENG